MPTWLRVLGLMVLAIMLVKAAVIVVLARRYHARGTRDLRVKTPITPRVTVIVPAHNETATIGNCLQGLAQQTYAPLDVLVVDDGSSDCTSEAAEQAAAGLADRVPIAVARKGNGGKASALNFGLLMTAADIVVCVDADSVLAPDAIERIIEPFADPSVGAVGGMVKIANSGTILGGQQAMEYIGGLALQRSAFAELDSVQVLSGANSAFRRDVLREIGGYSSDTLVEDFDVTVAVHAAGHRVTLQPDSVAYTEGPLNLSDLTKQRYRWTYGGFQVLAKYRAALFTGRFGRLSRLGLPYSLIFPWIDVLGSALFVAMLVFSLATGGILVHGAYLAAMSAINLAMYLFALSLTGDRKRLALWGLLSPLFYSHVLTSTTARAGWGYLAKKQAFWQSLARGGSNVLQAPAARRRDLSS